MIGLAVIAVWVAPERLKDWRILIAVLALTAFIALIAQVLLQSREDHVREDREKERDARDAITHKTVLWLQQRANIPETKVASLTVDAVLVTKSPRVYIEVKSLGKGLAHKTDIILSNHGEDVAHKVQLKSLILHSGRISFDKIETIAAGTKKDILATVENRSPVFRHNINTVFIMEWDALREPTSELSFPMSIQYEDVFKKQFETVFDLVYLPIMDIVGQNPFEVRNVKIRPLSQTAA